MTSTQYTRNALQPTWSLLAFEARFGAGARQSAARLTLAAAALPRDADAILLLPPAALPDRSCAADAVAAADSAAFGAPPFRRCHMRSILAFFALTRGSSGSSSCNKLAEVSTLADVSWLFECSSSASSSSSASLSFWRAGARLKGGSHEGYARVSMFGLCKIIMCT